MAQDFESNGKRITNSATTIYTSNSDDAILSFKSSDVDAFPRGAVRS